MTTIERENRLYDIEHELLRIKDEHAAGMLTDGAITNRLAKLAAERSALLDLGNGQAEAEPAPAPVGGELTLREVARVAADAFMIVAAELKRASTKG